MTDANFTVNANSVPEQDLSKQWNIKLLMEKVLVLQDLLLQAQEKNLLLSVQARELEHTARDTEDLKTELNTQGLILADKTRENKSLHQEFSRISNLLDTKVQEVEELKVVIMELQQQVKSKEQERDILTIMLNEMENAQKQTNLQEHNLKITSQQEAVSAKKQMTLGNWWRNFKGHFQ